MTLGSECNLHLRVTQSSPLQFVAVLLHSKGLQVWEDYFCSAFVKTVQKNQEQVAMGQGPGFISSSAGWT